jgi:hypothetical protein
MTSCERSAATSVSSPVEQTVTASALTATDGPLSEVNTPASIDRLAPSLAKFQPRVSIVSPLADRILDDDFPLFKSKELGLGNHLHVILDKQTYRGVYDLSQPLVFENLAPGTHTLRVFASRPWHESFKNPGAYAQTTFHILTKTAENNPDPSKPLLTYSRPAGKYGAEPIMLDYYLTAAPSHVTTTDGAETIPDWKIRVTINNQQFILDRWAPIYLQGFKPGKNLVKMELLDDRGNPIPNVYNESIGVFEYDPTSIDSLSQLVQGKIPDDLDRSLVDPNYTIAKTRVPAVNEVVRAPQTTPPVASPLPSPSVAPSATPSPVTLAPSPQPTPIPSITPTFPQQPLAVPSFVTPPLPSPPPVNVPPAPVLALPSPSPVAPIPQSTSLPAILAPQPSPVVTVAPPQPIASPSPAIVTPPVLVPGPLPTAPQPQQPSAIPSPVVVLPQQPLPLPIPVMLVQQQPKNSPSTAPVATPSPIPVPPPIATPIVPTPTPTPTPQPLAKPKPSAIVVAPAVPIVVPVPTTPNQPTHTPPQQPTTPQPIAPSPPPSLQIDRPESAPVVASDRNEWQAKAMEIIQFLGVKIRAFTNTIPGKAQRFSHNVQVWTGQAIEWGSEVIRSWQEQHGGSTG